MNHRLCPDRDDVLAVVRPASLVADVSRRAVICPDCSAIVAVAADALIDSKVAVPVHLHRSVDI